MPVVVHREDLHDALIAGLGDRVELRTGVTVRTVRAAPGERPAVGDGRHTVEADLVVAADGTDSVIRRQLAPESAVVSSGCAAWRAVIPWYRAPKLPADQPVGGETLGAGYRFVAASLGERGAAGGVQPGRHLLGGHRRRGAPPRAAGRPSSPCSSAGTRAGPRRSASCSTRPSPADLVQQEIRELRPLPRAYGFPAGPGGVVLLGDAAHAMPPHLGQGACLAFEDAATLAVAAARVPAARRRAVVRPVAPPPGGDRGPADPPDVRGVADPGPAGPAGP